MKKTYAVLSAFIILFLLAVPVGATKPMEEPFTPPDLENLIVFGDSLSDSGNVFNISYGLAPDQNDYWQGRFSNGPVWSENMADFMGITNDYLLTNFIPFSAAPITYTTPMFFNNAFGGAPTKAAVMTFRDQVATWVVSNTVIPPKSLVVVWIGANDFLGYGGDPSGAASIIGNALTNIDTGLTGLAAIGATHIAICNLPDLGSTPLNLGTPNEEGAREITNGFNQGLAQTVDAFAARFAGTVYQVDVNGMFAEAIANPAKFGVTNVVSAALTLEKGFEEADGFLFWDDIHPTRRAHEQLGALIYGNVFISGTVGADYIKTKGLTGDVIGISCSNGTINSIDFADVGATAVEGKPTKLLYGLLDFSVTLNTPGDTARIVIDLPTALPKDYSWYKYVNGSWVDFTNVFKSSGGAQGAQISDDRKQVVLLIADDGDYDKNKAPGTVADPVAAGKLEVSNPPYESHDEDCFIQSLNADTSVFWSLALLAGLFIFSLALRAKRA